MKDFKQDQNLLADKCLDGFPGHLSFINIDRKDIERMNEIWSRKDGKAKYIGTESLCR